MLRRYRPQEVIRVLQYFEWEVVRQRGSHVILNHAGQQGHVAVPLPGREVPMGTLANIRRQAGLTPRQFDAAAEEVL